MTKEELKEYMKAYHKAHKEQRKAYYQSHKEQAKAWYQANKEERRDYHRDYSKDYYKSELNALGKTKASIRLKSQRILKQMNLHIDGYEIHHCFGYEDPSKFIYCSKSLHLKIHQYLRDNHIDADTDHYLQIRDIVNSTYEFIYIKC